MYVQGHAYVYVGCIVSAGLHACVCICVYACAAYMCAGTHI